VGRLRPPRGPERAPSRRHGERLHRVRARRAQGGVRRGGPRGRDHGGRRVSSASTWPSIRGAGRRSRRPSKRARPRRPSAWTSGARPAGR
jgi:hypothetical protein